MKPLDDSLKQRLLGALVLLALAVIFLPVLFDRESITPVDRTSQIPVPPEIVTVIVREPDVPALPKPAPPPAEMFIPDEQKVADETPEAPGLDAQGVPGAWVLQVASFRQVAHAERLRVQLMEAGYTAYTRQVSYKNGDVIRVYVGPKLDKGTLLGKKTAIDSRFGVDALLLPFTP